LLSLRANREDPGGNITDKYVIRPRSGGGREMALPSRNNCSHATQVA